MTRSFVLSVIAVAGTISIAAASYQAPSAALSPAALEATKIEKVKENLYIITGSNPTDRAAFSGGNTAVFITDTGVVLVDTKLAGWGQVILDKVKSVTDKPVTTIINTHTHGDHTRSNSFFNPTFENGPPENTKAHMAKMEALQGGTP